MFDLILHTVSHPPGYTPLMGPGVLMPQCSLVVGLGFASLGVGDFEMKFRVQDSWRNETPRSPPEAREVVSG